VPFAAAGCCAFKRRCACSPYKQISNLPNLFRFSVQDIAAPPAPLASFVLDFKREGFHGAWNAGYAFVPGIANDAVAYDYRGVPFVAINDGPEMAMASPFDVYWGCSPLGGPSFYMSVLTPCSASEGVSDCCGSGSASAFLEFSSWFEAADVVLFLNFRAIVSCDDTLQAALTARIEGGEEGLVLSKIDFGAQSGTVPRRIKASAPQVSVGDVFRFEVHSSSGRRGCAQAALDSWEFWRAADAAALDI
jgi:hypothetical protein